MDIKVLKIDKNQFKELGIENWPIWSCEVKEFDWYYDETEICYFIEGKVKVKTKEKEFEIKKGDLAIFPQGLSCKWNVVEPVKKHYSFDREIVQKLLKK